MSLREKAMGKVWSWTKEAEGEEIVEAEVEEEEEDMVGKTICGSWYHERVTEKPMRKTKGQHTKRKREILFLTYWYIEKGGIYKGESMHYVKGVVCFLLTRIKWEYTNHKYSNQHTTQVSMFFLLHF